MTGALHLLLAVVYWYAICAGAVTVLILGRCAAVIWVDRRRELGRGEQPFPSDDDWRWPR